MASRHPPPVRRQSGSGTRYQQDEPSPSHSKVGPAGVDAMGPERGPPQMNTGTELWLFIVSVAASALGGMLGMASGIFIVPILTMWGHVDIRSAIGASIVSVIACSCGSAGSFLRGRLTNVRLAILLETATTSGALSGVLLAGAIPVSYLFLILGMVLLVSAHQMLAKRRDSGLARIQFPT